MKANLTHELFAKHMNELKVVYARERLVCVQRKFRWDFVIWGNGTDNEDPGWGIEIDGYHKGRHGKGWGGDNEKMNLATVNGWRFLRFSTSDVKTGKAKQFIAEHLLGK